MTAFFDMPWIRPSSKLDEPVQSWLLSEAAVRLRALGRLIEALEPMRVAAKMSIKAERWRNAAIGTSNFSELEVVLGVLEVAVADARRAISYADRIDPPDLFWQSCSRAAAANALHQWRGTQGHGHRPRGAGSAEAMTEARQLFEQAEVLQRQDQPHYDLLYSVRGFDYCDLILAPAELMAWRCLLALRVLGSSTTSTAMRPTPPEPRAQQQSPVDAPSASSATRSESHPEATEALVEAERRASYALSISTQRLGLLSIALDYLTLARVALYRALLDPAARTAYTAQPARTALDALRKANSLSHLPKALLTAAIAHYLADDPDTARDLLDEAQQIAERGPMPLCLADVHLHRARLVGVLGADERRKHWPDVDPRAELARARELIDKHHYGRRFEELADAEAAASHWR